MTNQTLPPDATTYLADLRSAVADLPPDVGDDIVADIRAHLTDAVAAGRPLDEVMHSLGPAGQVAAEVRDSLGYGPDAATETVPVEDAATARARRARTGLSVAAVAVGLLTAVFVSFLLPGFTTGRAVPEDETSVQRFGLTLAAASLLPALVAAVVLLVPPRFRARTALVSAIALTLLALTSQLSPATLGLGLMWLPQAMLAWAAVIVPWRVRRRPGSPAHLAWRIAAAVVLAGPGVVGVLGVLDRDVRLDPVAAVWIVTGPVLAVLYVVGVRVARLAVAGIGALVMLASVVMIGVLSPLFWLVGGVWLVLGLAALARDGWRLRGR